MAIYYAARETFDKGTDKDSKNWNSYIAWRGFTHLSEVISLDSLLNKNLIKIESYSAEDWEQAVIHDQCVTGLFKTLEPVLSKVRLVEKFNLLAVEIEPAEACNNKEPEGFEFAGYDLMDKWFDISSLTNCSGFEQSYSSADINAYGLLKDWEQAYRIKEKLLETNSGHPHSDTYVIAIWRHKTIGRP
jgi:hypothetical protein